MYLDCDSKMRVVVRDLFGGDTFDPRVIVDGQVVGRSAQAQQCGVSRFPFMSLIKSFIAQSD